jgi:hypothetical protein
MGVLRALERGDIDLDEARARLETLDRGEPLDRGESHDRGTPLDPLGPIVPLDPDKEADHA